MRPYLFLLLNLAALQVAAAAAPPQSLFYLSREAKSVQPFLAHAALA